MCSMCVGAVYVGAVCVRCMCGCGVYMSVVYAWVLCLCVCVCVGILYVCGVCVYVWVRWVLGVVYVWVRCG